MCSFHAASGRWAAALVVCGCRGDKVESAALTPTHQMRWSLMAHGQQTTASGHTGWWIGHDLGLLSANDAARLTASAFRGLGHLSLESLREGCHLGFVGLRNPDLLL